MRVVYEPDNIIDAHLMKGALEHAGIPVYLRGEYLVGGIGELPAPGLLALCVSEDFEDEAREVLADLDRNRVRDGMSERSVDDDWIGVLAV